jgi:glycosyltransferase involved in cell wall biosynthesis
MRVLHVGDIGNYALNTVKWLRKAGVEAELLVQPTPKNSVPLTDEFGKPPEWVHEWKGSNYLSKALYLLLKSRDYDILQGYGSATAYLPFCGKPYFSYALGSDLRLEAVSGTLKGRLLMNGFKNSKVMFFGPDRATLDIIKRYDLHQAKFIPQIIDSGLFSPGKSKIKGYKDNFVVFNASSLYWGGMDKGKKTQYLVNAFAEFASEVKEAKLIMPFLGPDKEKTRDLVRKLKLDEKVDFIPRQTKTQLVEYYRLADVVTDQFEVDTLGLVSREALSTGKPLITRCGKELHEKFYAEAPPILYASTTQEITKRLFESTDNKKMAALGKRSREWILEYHDNAKNTRKLISLYERVI